MLTNSVILSESMKKKLFDTKLAQAAVLVQYTRTIDQPIETPVEVPTEASLNLNSSCFVGS